MSKGLSRSMAASIVIREKLALDLCDEIYMQKEEALEIIEFAFQVSGKLPQTYNQLKQEIKSYIIINMLSLIVKFQ